MASTVDVRTQRNRYVDKLTAKYPQIDEYMAMQVFDWNFEHPNDKIELELIEKVKEITENSVVDIGHLASTNSETRWNELKKVLGDELYNEIFKSNQIRGFWGKFVLNLVKGDLSVKEIRQKNYQRNNTGKWSVNIEAEIHRRCPQFEELTIEAQNEIRKEISKKITLG